MELHQVIDEVLWRSWANLKPRHRDLIKHSWARPNLSELQNVDVTHLVNCERGDVIYADQTATPDVVWPVDVAIGSKRDNGDWHFDRLRTVTPKEVRGRAKTISRFMLERTNYELHANNTFTNLRTILVLVNGRWCDAIFGNDAGERIDTQGRLAVGFALVQRYEWSVTIQVPDGPSFRFATDAEGVKAFFADRDKGTNGRRDALKHWVTDHFRQSRHDPELEVYVRKHLRAGERFSWRGFHCTWRPSDFDMELNQRLKQERETIRKG